MKTKQINRGYSNPMNQSHWEETGQRDVEPYFGMWLKLQSLNQRFWIKCMTTQT